MISNGDYNVLDGLRRNLKEKRELRKAKKLEIRGRQDYLRILRSDMQEKYSHYKKGLENELRNQRHEMEINRDMMASEGFTNQTKWKTEVRKRTQLQEDENNQKIHDYKAHQDQDVQVLENQIQAMNDEISDLDIEIDDIKWDLRIKLETYKEYQIVQVI